MELCKSPDGWLAFENFVMLLSSNYYIHCFFYLCVAICILWIPLEVKKLIFKNVVRARMCVSQIQYHYIIVR